MAKSTSKPSAPIATRTELMDVLRAWVQNASPKKKFPEPLRLSISGEGCMVEIEMRENNYSVEWMEEEIDEEGYGGENNREEFVESLEDVAELFFPSSSARLNKDDILPTAITKPSDFLKAHNAQHTAGPWDYADTAGSHQYAIFEEKNGRDVAIVYNRGEEAAPTARLIAAAPELLEACEKLLYASECREDGDDNWMAPLQDAFTFAKEAIAKVEGKA